MADEYVLAIDCGTQSTRALLFDARGNLVAKSRVVHDAFLTAHPGWVEYPAPAYWRAVCEACHALWKLVDIPAGALQGVAVTTQRGTMVNLDRDGEPLRPAIVWLDQRKATRLPQLPWWWSAAFRLARVDATVRFFMHQAYSNWLAEHQPALWRDTHKYLLLSGYLNFRLCGEYVDSTASQVGYIPFSYRRHRWAADLDWKWSAVPMRPDQLPKLVAPATMMGKVRAEAAVATGIPAGTPLIAAAADKACEVLGAGCISPEVGCLSYGTAAAINSTGPRYVEATPFIPPFPSAVPGHYSTEVQIYRGFWMVSWFKEQFAQIEKLAAEARGVAPERVLDDLVASVPPGAMGLMLQPYWTPGIKLPGPEAKGAIIGFGDVHTRAHLYRAILEGLAYGLREGRERIERRSGVAMRGLRVVGGGSQSDAVMQISADVFNLPAARPHVYEASGLGAAVIACVGLGLHRDFDAALKAMTRIGAGFAPDPQRAGVYAELYERVYLRMYRRLQPLYREIARITGYPAAPGDD